MRKVDPDKHDARVRQILDAARACFAEKGFHQTSTAAICARAGMSPGNLFHYFSSKQAIIAAIVDGERRDVAEYFSSAMQAADLLGEILAFMDMILALAADKTFAGLALEIAAEATRDPEIGARVSRNDVELRGALQALIIAAEERGQVGRALPSADAATWIATLIDGIFSRVGIDPDFSPKAHSSTLRLMITRMLCADAAGHSGVASL
ncbi:TetR/AcrR family transcriptional regulator [Neorhizobium tomejilense]|jgi:TetR/AcrR family transcriptional repressor of uid operon|uniref:TetR/AcrR family transcriptional regulator n=1 Tax=Neorhizobium tomejilense TaxID=2093828 RepID=UPI000CF88D3F|nr:TetR/AcrR family transcriptional regulator [Neorhizobium tomejilense]